jgi:molecular chaperone GrpE
MAERNEYLTALQRLQADFENYRKRVQRQQEEQSTRATANVVSKLLPVLDTLDLAELHLGAAPAGGHSDEVKALRAARSQLLDTLEKEGLERVDRAGVRFDPVVHDAVAHVPLDETAPDSAQDESGVAPAGQAHEGADVGADVQRADSRGDEPAGNGATDAAQVDEVFRAGYRWHGQVLRPAMVRVKG